MTRAVDLNASDVHFEASRHGFSCRIRVDGLLQPYRDFDPAMRLPVLSRLKIMSELNIAETRLPQDGLARATIRGRTVSFRVSCIPTESGESVVFRLLDRSPEHLNWDDLGFSKEDQAKISEILSHPDGLFVVAGPTGSGKTTTLYTVMKDLYTPEKKFITVEDPVEYALDFATQIQVDAEIGLTFAQALRSILRHDFNVLMIGEIRDAETAKIAVEASLAGRLVMTTTHASSTEGAVDRLVGFGIDRTLFTGTLNGVVKQELTSIGQSGLKGGKRQLSLEIASYKVN